MADVNRGNRPLSPHLTIYRPQFTSVTSILTRITGNALIVGTLLTVWWLIALASGPEYFECANAVMTSWFGKLVMLGSLWALSYHYMAGLRHLWWDSGRGFELDKAKTLAIVVVAGSFVLTILALLII
ncbi:succinate dehydrogenase, cytochrome b556 subunit [Halocynthiibacter styelae]|uniref:Succinate dehydrogenase cytochrome b556 subunit n=1 Tax=Halocynthiibacter styelae TaxID=2761955 RepID=A0A8J7IUM2_9RHOB|nr:succinate dehydrogenase, cytochrome b556 subunit [Paenihalocynthiibacter styelae]MBI1492738.1 succinate dehydrogenase, cytochrome b556 subunit [Paenihalocynthiibacter styelae]